MLDLTAAALRYNPRDAGLFPPLLLVVTESLVRIDPICTDQGPITISEPDPVIMAATLARHGYTVCIGKLLGGYVCCAPSFAPRASRAIVWWIVCDDGRTVSADTLGGALARAGHTVRHIRFWTGPPVAQSAPVDSVISPGGLLDLRPMTHSTEPKTQR